MTNPPFRNVLGLNQQTYQRLKMSLSLNLRRQIFIAVCDDLPLRDRLAAQLQTDFAPVSLSGGQSDRTKRSVSSELHSHPRLITLNLDINDPDPIGQIAHWLKQSSLIKMGGRRVPMPAFQILGIEHLTRQSAATQRLFLTHLQSIERNLPLLESSLLMWVTQPWFRTLPQSAPDFWRCWTGIFEFVGDPTPLPATSPESIWVQPQRQVQLSSQVSGQLSSEQLLSEQPLSEQLLSGQAFITATAQAADSATPPPTQASAIDPQDNPWTKLAQELGQLYETEEDENLIVEPLPAISAEQANEQSNQLSAEELLNQLLEDRSDDRPSFRSPASVASHKTHPNHNEEKLGSEALSPVAVLQHQIEHLRQQQADPETLANAYRTLGNLYRDRIEHGEATSENLTIAIQAYEKVLGWLPERSPLRVEVLNDLGNLFWIQSRARSDPYEALSLLQQSIQLYQAAITQSTPQAQSQIYAMVQNNLGAAYSDLARYQDAAQNLQLSVQAYQQALLYRKVETDPLRYASTQNNLGTTYWNLAQQQHPEANLKQAIAAYSEALHHYNPEQDPLNYAMIQNNLGTAYWNLAQFERPQDWLKLALASYRMALKHRTMETAPAAFAATQNNLGTAYWHMASYTEDSQTRQDYLKEAIASYKATLSAAAHLAQHRAAPLNFDLFATQNNLGLAHYQLATDLQGNLSSDGQATHLEAALRSHLLAFQGWAPKPELQQTAFNCILQTIRAFYTQLGLPGQNRALSIVPASLLGEILPQL